MRKSYEKAWKSQECPSSPGFPGILGKARKARRKFSTLSGLFLMCKNHRSFWQEGFLALPGSSLILGFPGKPRKSRENVHAFQAFPYVQKSLDWASDQNDFKHSWLLLDSRVSWKSQEKIFHAFQAIPFQKSLEPLQTFYNMMIISLDSGVSWEA